MGTILQFPPRLRLVPSEPTLLQRMRASLTPAPSGWHCARVMVRAIGITGRVEGWSPDMGKLGVAYDDGECGFHDAVALDRLPNNPGGRSA